MTQDDREGKLTLTFIVKCRVKINFEEIGQKGEYKRDMETSGIQIYGGPGSLSHDFKIWPITFQGSGPSGPILFSGEKFSL